MESVIVVNYHFQPVDTKSFEMTTIPQYQILLTSIVDSGSNR